MMVLGDLAVPFLRTRLRTRLRTGLEGMLSFV